MWPADEESKSHRHAKGLITLWFPRFLRKCTGFSDSIESIDSMNSIYCDIFYHKSITSNRSLIPSINLSRMVKQLI
jgi:hypothetical protein